MTSDLPFPTVWAVNGPVRDPTAPELDQGFPCGEADRLLFNGLFQDMQQAINAFALQNGSADIPVMGWQGAPPSSPATGDRYIVAASPTGAWAGRATKVAIWAGSAWGFVDPVVGLLANYWDGSKLNLIFFNGTAWADFPIVSVSNFAQVYADAGRPPQAAPYFLANGIGNSATYVNNIQTNSSDMTLQGSQFLDAATTFSAGVLTVGPNDAGVWSFSTNLGINIPTNGWTSKVHLIKNGAIIIGFAEVPIYGTASTGNLGCSGTVRLASGDTVVSRMLQNTGSSQTSSSFGRFSGSRIGV